MRETSLYKLFKVRQNSHKYSIDDKWGKPIWNCISCLSKIDSSVQVDTAQTAREETSLDSTEYFSRMNFVRMELMRNWETSLNFTSYLSNMNPSEQY